MADASTARRHHESERRIPCARDVEKAEHARRVDHVRKREAGPEHDTRKQGRKSGAHAQRSHQMASDEDGRDAAAMKVTVAAIERGDRRAMPQTPCPLVQPLPRRVPNPTSSPAAISSGTDEVTSICGSRTNVAIARRAERQADDEGRGLRHGGPASAIRDDGGEHAADAGDAAGEQQKQCARRSRSAARRRRRMTGESGSRHHSTFSGSLR